ncbi:MAG: hypothetical protein ACLQGP_03470 [Isosphaeraceae bacterium]
MAKTPITLAPDLHPDRRRSRLLPIAAMFVSIILTTPVLVEVASLCYAQWSEILGTPVSVRTPILDAFCDRVEAFRQNLGFRVYSYFQQVPWDPKVVLPTIAVVMAIAMMMLRR